MSFKLAETTVASAVASAGTFNVGYPTNTNAGNYENTRGHKLWVDGHQKLYDYIDDFTISFGTSNITVTYNGSTTIPANTRVVMQLDQMGVDDALDLHDDSIEGVIAGAMIMLDLGAPDAIDVNGVIEAFSAAAGSQTLDGALASGGVVTFDVPRNIVVDSGGADTAVMTFTGTDIHGSVMSEAITLNGLTAVSGKKAFKTITALSTSATTSNGAFAGQGDVLGLPIRLPDTGYVVKEMEDGAAATAGTLVAGVDTAATTTTGDVRGTYDPNSAADGAKAFKLLIFGADPTDKGVAQV